MNKSRVIAFSVIIVLIVAAGAVGYFAGHRGGTAKPAATAHAGRTVLYWKVPMDPNYRSDKPGKSPMGMDLVPVYASEGGAEADDVTVSSATVNNLGVRTVEVKQGALAHRIEAVGYVGYDQDTVRSIHTRADGWLERLAVKKRGRPRRGRCAALRTVLAETRYRRAGISHRRGQRQPHDGARVARPTPAS